MPPRISTVDGLIAEYTGFADLVGVLPLPRWEAATRCEGWQVRDVAGHVLGSAEDVLAGRAGTRTPDEQAAEHRALSPDALSLRLRRTTADLRVLLDHLDERTWSRPGPIPEYTVGESVLNLWHDTYVHADDIRAALGLPSDRGPGLTASARWLRLVLRRRGLRPDLPADPLDLVLAATGRAGPTFFEADPSMNVYA